MNQDFKQVQKAFVAHLREPELSPGPEGIEDRRLKVYRELFFNNVLGFISNGFPVLESLYDTEQWQHLVRQFFIEHNCHSPYFAHISAEFVEYLTNEYQDVDSDYPFLQELAHYEWVELDVSIAQGICPGEETIGPDSQVYISPLARVLGYQFPVHKISPDYIPDGPEPVQLVVYRDSEDEVRFSKINQVTAYMLALLTQNEHLHLRKISELMQQALPQLPADQVNESVLQILQQMNALGVIGVVKN